MGDKKIAKVPLPDTITLPYKRPPISVDGYEAIKCDKKALMDRKRKDTYSVEYWEVLDTLRKDQLLDIIRGKIDMIETLMDIKEDLKKSLILQGGECGNNTQGTEKLPYTKTPYIKKSIKNSDSIENKNGAVNLDKDTPTSIDITSEHFDLELYKICLN